jgi:hypothetical protein
MTMGMNMKLGGGGRFASLEGKLAGQPGVRNPGALAASIGDKKYGIKKMAGLSHHGTGAAKMPNRPMATMFGGKR